VTASAPVSRERASAQTPRKSPAVEPPYTAAEKCA
jgi:hypothetical protein